MSSLSHGWEKICVAGWEIFTKIPVSGYGSGVVMVRQCSRAACSEQAVMTMTYDYAASMCVLGPLAPRRHPGGFDLCAHHGQHLSPPQGWTVVRLPMPDGGKVEPDDDDLQALADEIRAIGLGEMDADRRQAHQTAGIVELNRRGHLRVIADAASQQ